MHRNSLLYIVEVHASDTNHDPRCELGGEYLASIKILEDALQMPSSGVVVARQNLELQEGYKIHIGYPALDTAIMPDNLFESLSVNYTNHIFLTGRYYGSCVATTLNRLLIYLTKKFDGSNPIPFCLHIPTFLIDRGREGEDDTHWFDNYEVQSGKYRDFLMGEVSHFFPITFYMDGVHQVINNILQKDKGRYPINVYYWRSMEEIRRWFIEHPNG